MSKLWGGRFEKPTDELVERFGASIHFDQRLAEEDLIGSIAHATMLAKTGIIPAADGDLLVAGLKRLLERQRTSGLPFSPKDEDVHMNMERLLSEDIGPVAGKLHSARSRNDQVALDLRLYLRRIAVETVDLLRRNQEALLEQARLNEDVIIPGYTHLQRAQPVLLAHHLLAYFWMFERDISRLVDSWKRINVMPLGAGALAGTSFPIDRESVAKQLKFDGVTENSLDTVSDRDLVVEFLACCSLIMTHLSRLSEELIIWTSTEFGYLELDDAFTTGSSMMPQKKNPDVAELVRGKTGRVHGSLVSVLTMLKGLPLSYNRDMQEDKEQLFDAVDTVTNSLAVYARMLGGITVRRERIAEAMKRDFSNATDVADYLAKRGLPFREAHEVVGKLVRFSIDHGKVLLELTLEEFRTFSPLFDQDVFRTLDPKEVVAARKSSGGTAPEAVLKQRSRAEAALARATEWVREKQAIIEAAAS